MTEVTIVETVVTQFIHKNLVGSNNDNNAEVTAENLDPDADKTADELRDEINGQLRLF